MPDRRCTRGLKRQGHVLPNRNAAHVTAGRGAVASAAWVARSKHLVVVQVRAERRPVVGVADRHVRCRVVALDRGGKVHEPGPEPARVVPLGAKKARAVVVWGWVSCTVGLEMHVARAEQWSRNAADRWTDLLSVIFSRTTVSCGRALIMFRSAGERVSHAVQPKRDEEKGTPTPHAHTLTPQRAQWYRCSANAPLVEWPAGDPDPRGHAGFGEGGMKRPRPPRQLPYRPCSAGNPAEMRRWRAPPASP